LEFIGILVDPFFVAVTIQINPKYSMACRLTWLAVLITVRGLLGNKDPIVLFKCHYKGQ
jgi:hypothetical protein